MTLNGIKFIFKGKPYEVLYHSETKIDGKWTNSIVYKALNTEGNKIFGSVYVRTESDVEWNDFIESIFLAQDKEKSGRRIGNTTRLADFYIQVLFNRGEVQVQDHHSDYNSHRALLERILKRITTEHPRVNLEVNRVKLTIKIVQNVRAC